MMIRGYGPAEVFEPGQVEDPRPGPGQALIRVHGSSVNPLDAGIRAGTLKLFVSIEMPAVLGVDLAGEVVALGEGADRYSVGDRVYAYTGVGAGGGYGELAVVDERCLARVPERLDLVEAGSVPGVGATAYEAFTVHAPLGPGMRVFVNGAAGGVGTWAIQVARALGADVVGTCSTSKLELVRGLGAEPLDYTVGDPFSEKGAYDVVLNAVRGAPKGPLRSLLRDGGTLVTVVGSPVDAVTSKVGNLLRKTRLVPFFVSSESTCLEGLSELIAAGSVRPVIERTYPLGELAEAHRRVETGRVAGKVCIDVIQE